MKSKTDLSELFEQGRKAAPEAPLDKVLSVLGTGKTSPLAAKYSLRPKRIKLFINPLKILIMITPIVLISSLFLFVNPDHFDKTGAQENEKFRLIQNADSNQLVTEKPATPLDLVQQVPENREEPKTDIANFQDSAVVTAIPTDSTSMKSLTGETIREKVVTKDSEVTEHHSEQLILRVNIDFFKAMGVHVFNDSYSVYSKDVTESKLVQGSMLTMHVFKKARVTSYDNWTDTIWQPGEEIPTLAAITNVSGLYSYGFANDNFFPHVTIEEIIQNRLEMCVAVSLDYQDTLSPLYGPVFWYYPNEKFLKSLPTEIAEPLKREFNYQVTRNDTTYITGRDETIGIGKPELKKSFGNPVNEPVPCVYFKNLCESIPGLDYINLYPNPATDKLNVDLVLQRAKKIQFRVFDLGGRVISDEGPHEYFPEGGQFKHQLEITNLQAGLYLLVMTDEEGAKLTRRFVKN